MTARIEAQIERFAPGFRDLVLARRTRTAAGEEAANPNYVGGDIAAGMQTVWQTVFRPAVRWNPYRTPVPGLYLCSSSTPPLPGVHGRCGELAALTALRDVFGVRTPPDLGLARPRPAAAAAEWAMTAGPAPVPAAGAPADTTGAGGPARGAVLLFSAITIVQSAASHRITLGSFNTGAGLMLTLWVIAAVGLVVAWHQPGNPIGWLLLAAPTSLAADLRQRRIRRGLPGRPAHPAGAGPGGAYLSPSCSSSRSSPSRSSSGCSRTGGSRPDAGSGCSGSPWRSPCRASCRCSGSPSRPRPGTTSTSCPTGNCPRWRIPRRRSSAGSPCCSSSGCWPAGWARWPGRSPAGGGPPASAASS